MWGTYVLRTKHGHAPSLHISHRYKFLPFFYLRFDLISSPYSVSIQRRCHRHPPLPPLPKTPLYGSVHTQRLHSYSCFIAVIKYKLLSPFFCFFLLFRSISTCTQPIPHVDPTPAPPCHSAIARFITPHSIAPSQIQNKPT